MLVAHHCVYVFMLWPSTVLLLFLFRWVFWTLSGNKADETFFFVQFLCFCNRRENCTNYRALLCGKLKFILKTRATDGNGYQYSICLFFRPKLKKKTIIDFTSISIWTYDVISHRNDVRIYASNGKHSKYPWTNFPPTHTIFIYRPKKFTLHELIRHYCHCFVLSLLLLTQL